MTIRGLLINRYNLIIISLTCSVLLILILRFSKFSYAGLSGVQKEHFKYWKICIEWKNIYLKDVINLRTLKYFKSIACHRGLAGFLSRDPARHKHMSHDRCLYSNMVALSPVLVLTYLSYFHSAVLSFPLDQQSHDTSSCGYKVSEKAMLIYFWVYSIWKTAVSLLLYRCYWKVQLPFHSADFCYCCWWSADCNLRSMHTKMIAAKGTKSACFRTKMCFYSSNHQSVHCN